MGVYMKNVYIIINYNDYENTSKLINNIQDYNIIDEILIVDNCSKKDCYEKLKKIQLKKLTIIKTEENKGYGYAINFAAKYCIKKNGDCNLIVSNSDIEIKEELVLIKLLKYLDDNKDVAIISPKINEHGEISYGWKIPNILDALILNVPIINRNYEKKNLYYNKDYFDKPIKEVEVVSGCFFIIKANNLKEINYFDENVFLYYEENIISTKLKRKNKKIMLDTDVEILHNHSKTINKNINEYNKLKILKSSQYYFYKNYTKSNKILLCFLKLSNCIVLTLKKVKVGTKN